jgi:hypothetical protein
LATSSWRRSCQPPHSSDQENSTSGTRRYTPSGERAPQRFTPHSSVVQPDAQALLRPGGQTPERITSAEVFSWAHGIGLSGKRPSAITIGARLACLSSFYRFLIRMGLMAANPCEAIERPKMVASQPRGLSADDIRKLLAGIPDTPRGLRDRAIVLTLTFMVDGGRRLLSALLLRGRPLRGERRTFMHGSRRRRGSPSNARRDTGDAPTGQGPKASYNRAGRVGLITPVSLASWKVRPRPLSSHRPGGALSGRFRPAAVLA